MSFNGRESNNERRNKGGGDISVKDLLVVVRNNDTQADKYEYKRVKVDERKNVRKKMRKMQEDSMLLGPGKRPLRWFNGDKIQMELGIDATRRPFESKPHIVQHYEM